MSGPVIGIDLGTTNSLAAWVPEVEPEVVPGVPRAIVPSVVSREGDRWIVGDAARSRRLTHPESTIFSAKRFLGKSLGEVRDLLEGLPFGVSEGDSGHLMIETAEGSWAPEQISSMILAEIKRRAEAHFDESVTRAVITVPAYFDDVQRAATRQAAEMAGLDVMRLMNEPTAAALAYGLDDRDRGNLVVFDLGGGTFDVSVLKLEDGVFQVLSTAGDTLLGGDDFDELIMQFLMSEIPGSQDDPRRLQDLRKVAEQGKIALSSAPAVDLVLQAPGKEPVTRRFTREQFEESIRPHVQRCLNCLSRAVAEAGLTMKDLDEVVLVGGSTRIPMVRREVASMTGREPLCSLNPDEVVALGAAVQAHILAGGSRDILLLDVTPLSLGLEILGGGMSRLIHKNTAIPCEASDEFTTSADNQTGLDLHVLQGERELAEHNRSLGRYRLSGFPPMPAGIPKFKVSFRLDANGLLTVNAVEERSDTRLEVRLMPNRGLTEDQVESMRKDAIEHSREDLQAIRAINITNEARVVLGATRKALESVRGSLPAGITDDDYAAMHQAADALQQALDDQDTVLVEFVHEELNNLTAPLADTIMSSIARELDAAQGKES